MVKSDFWFEEKWRRWMGFRCVSLREVVGVKI